ncbi:gamma-glutamyl-gamma-aminobutyrate hydrolase family protein [Virgibacillus sp. W0430]|uniref:gamma-glutamyl-gamma-aminobutyrate hydrolase family protein n=1 Tax=Virgibacillus sp. W0430 TaxID=3391580 RepID=UPI003F470F9B
MGDKLINVGVTGYFVSSEQNKQGWIKGVPGQQFSMFSYDFVESIVGSGAVPTLLPVVPKGHIKHQLATIDALVLAGGEDVHPKHYDENDLKEDSSISHERDEYEFELLKQALQLDIPILLVCRGMQLLNILQKGSLYKDINTELKTPIEHLILKDRDKAVHNVSLKANNFVTTLMGEHLQVNSIHHQSINRLGECLEVIGTSEDGIVEVVTFTNREDVIAVQWHPEMMYKTSDHAVKLFNWLVNKAEIKK